MAVANEKVTRTNFEVRGNMRKFWKSKRLESVLAGPAGTGKTRVILERQHLLLNKYPRARGLMVRKFRSSMNETCLDTYKNEVIRDSHGELYPDAPVWRERDQKFVYENGSEYIVAGMDDPSKIMSSKYDFFYWNEAIESKRAEWEAIMSRLRNFVIPYQQAIGDTNPGPPTHWIRQRGLEGKLDFYDTEHKDNPVYWDVRAKKGRGDWTAKGKMYVHNILRDGLTGLLYKRLYEGKWVLAEGQVYDAFDHELHVVKRRPIPHSWPRYWGFDFGYIDPFVWQEWAEDPETGALTMIRELYHSQLRVEEACNIIREAGWDVPPMALICDHDAENRATLEKEFGMLTLPAFKLIAPGIQAVQRRLQINKQIGKPMLFIMEDANIKTDRKLIERHHPTCTLEEIDNYVWDTKNISLDRYKDQPVDQYNHGMDTMRYVGAFVDNAAEDPHDFSGVVSAKDLFLDDDLMHSMETMISVF